MSYMEDDFYCAVLNFYKENKWKNILNLNEHSNIPIADRILWVWPSEKEIKFIKNVALKYGLVGITSIGCGSGLLEWILQQSTGLKVEGIEVNEEWWLSKYSCPPFIELKFPTFPLEEKVLNPNSALLFCYFNNGAAFEDYVQNYRGNVVIIIGPSYGKGRHTDPQPFGAKFPTSDWTLECYMEVKQTKDYIACYVR